MAPNPALDVLYLSASLREQGEASFELFDASGRTVHLSQYWVVSGSQKTVDIASLPSGMYHWRFRANGFVDTGRLAKQ